MVDIVDAGPVFDDVEGEEATQSTGDATENTAKRQGDLRVHDTLPSANGRRRVPEPIDAIEKGEEQ